MRGISSTGLTVVLLLLDAGVTPAVAGRLPAETKAEDDLQTVRMRAERKGEAFRHRPVRKPGADADDLTKLLIERYEAARVEVSQLSVTLGEQLFMLDVRLGEAVKRLVEAELELATSREERLALLEGYVDYLKETEALMRAMFLSGARGISLADLARAKYVRLDAEIRLLRAKRENDPTRRP
jgi:hypothetical protein